MVMESLQDLNNRVAIIGDDTHRSMCSVCEKGCLPNGQCRYVGGN